jgi:hypothetical protein
MSLRAVNLWGFERIVTSGPERGAYFHKDFLKGQHDMVKRLTRQRGNKSEGQTHITPKTTKAKSPKLPKATSHSKQPRIKKPTTFATSVQRSEGNAIVTPPVSPRDVSGSQSFDSSLHQTGPQDATIESPFFEGCEFFLLDEDAKYCELADVLLETGFLTAPGDNDDEKMASSANFALPGPPSTLCRV